MSLLDDLASKLVADGVAVLSNNLFLGSSAVIPTGAGPYITLNETGGVAPTRVHNKTAAMTVRPNVQVLVRAQSYIVAKAKATLAYASLDGIFNTTINGIFYHKVTAKQEPTDMGSDVNGRVQFVFNVEIEKQP